MRAAKRTQTGQGWPRAESSLRRSGWSRDAWACCAARWMDRQLAVVDPSDPVQLRLSVGELRDKVQVYKKTKGHTGK
jgi:hypothetical protein